MHRHLDGSVRLQTILELADQYGIVLPARDVESLRPHVQVSDSEPGLMVFLKRFKYLTAVMVNADACRRIARENVIDAAREGIGYIELRFSPVFMAETHGLDPSEVVDAVIDGVRSGMDDTGIDARLIGIMSRTYGVDKCLEELNVLLSRKDKLVAIDLAGDEQKYPAKLFVEHFHKVRDAGLETTVHAGEADGPQSVWSAIRDIGTSRIGHGFRSIEDPELVDYLAKHQIGLEICLTSNIQIDAVENYRAHPAKRLLDAGVLLNLNTDNPAISGIDLKHEYDKAGPEAGFTLEDRRRLLQNGHAMAFARHKF